VTTIEEESDVKLTHRDHVIIAEFECCTRCGEMHENLDFARLDPPMDVGGVEFTHWALCPTKESPVLLKVETLSV
jgi:hypothetical protein